MSPPFTATLRTWAEPQAPCPASPSCPHRRVYGLETFPMTMTLGTGYFGESLCPDPPGPLPTSDEPPGPAVGFSHSHDHGSPPSLPISSLQDETLGSKHGCGWGPCRGRVLSPWGWRPSGCWFLGAGARPCGLQLDREWPDSLPRSHPPGQSDLPQWLHPGGLLRQWTGERPAHSGRARHLRPPARPQWHQQEVRASGCMLPEAARWGDPASRLIPGASQYLL